MIEDDIGAIGKAKGVAQDVSKAAFGSASGLKGLRTELALTAKVMGEGMAAGIITLVSGGGKVKAAWQAIEWAAIARAGLAGFAGLALAGQALAGGIRKIVAESGALQAAIDRLSTTKLLGDQFKLFMGSVDAAKKRVADLYSFTANSKFNFAEVAGASRTMTILSNGVLGGTESLKMLGRISASTGAPLEDLGNAYGRLNAQVRNSEDISSTIERFKEWGVITESTANKLIALQHTGAPPASLWDAVDKAITSVSENIGETSKTIGELESDADKARESMLAAFGTPFVPEHRKQIELTGQAYKNLTGAAAALGQTLATLTAPFESIKIRIKSIAATPVFAGIAKQAAEILPLIPVALAGRGILSGAAKFVTTTATKVKTGGIGEVASAALGAVSPAHQATRFAKTASSKGAQSELFAEAAKVAAELGDAKSASNLKNQATILKTVSGAANLAGKGMMTFSQGLGLVRAGAVRLLALAAPLLGFMAAVYAVTKLWQVYTNEVAKADRLDDMSAGIKRSTEALKAQLKEMKNTDDYLQVLADANRNLNDAMEERSKIRANPEASEDEQHAAEAGVAIAQKNLRMVQKTDRSNLAPGKAELDVLNERAAIEKEIRDMVFEAQFARASAGKQALMLAQEEAKYAKIAADYRAHETNEVPLAIARTNMEGAGARDKKNAETAAQAVTNAEKKLSDVQAQRPGLGSGFQTAKTGVASSDYDKKLAAAKAELEAAKAEKEAAATGPEAAKSRTALIGQLEKGSTGEQFEAAALRAEDKGARPGATTAEKQQSAQEASLFRQKETEAKIISKRESMEKEKEYSERRADLRKTLSLHAIDQETAAKLLTVNSETVQSEDVAARIQIEGNKKLLAEKVKDYEEQAPSGAPETDAQKDAAKAYEQQVNEINLANADIQKGITERARLRALEKAAWETSIQMQKLNSEALVAAAKGNFAAADAALLAAREAEDQQHDEERKRELLKTHKPEEAQEIQGKEKEERTRTREAQAESFRTSETRRAREMELENAATGIGPKTGTRGADANKELTRMKDQDMFNQQVLKNMEGLGPGHEGEAKQLAIRTTTADIISQAAGAGRGTGSVGDALTRVGGGGGFYAGASGDPQLTATKRIGDLLLITNEKLDNLKPKVVVK